MTARKKNFVSIGFILLLGALARGSAAYYSAGFQYADEHFQLLEPAFGLVHGFWMKSWEWEEGIRSWLGPFLIAAPLQVLSLFKNLDPEQTVLWIRQLSGLLSWVVIWSVYQISRQISGERVALWAATMIALWWSFICYGVHPSSESLSTSLSIFAFLGAFEAWHQEKECFGKAFLVGVLSGISFGVRFQTGFFGISFFILFLSKSIRSPLNGSDPKNGATSVWKSETTSFLGGLLLALLGVGMLDYFTWGQFLGSPWRYYDFNILRGVANQYGIAPWHRYLTAVSRFFTLPLALFGGFLFFQGLSGIKRNWPILVYIGPYLFVHQLLAHKEDRFLLPVLPALVLYAADGWKNWQTRRVKSRERTESTFLLVICLLGGGYEYIHHKWNWGSDTTQLYQEIGRQKNLVGFLDCGTTLDRTGGYFYLNKNVPLLIQSVAKDCPLWNKNEKWNYVLYREPLSTEMKGILNSVGCQSMDLELGKQIYFCH